MQRNRGKVPTPINKDNVATGEVKTQNQIKAEGSKAVSPKDKIIERVQQRHSQPILDPKAIIQERKPLQNMEYVKRINHGPDR